MRNGLQENLQVILSRAVEEAARTAGEKGKAALTASKDDSGNALGGVRGLLLGAGAAALAPAAVKGAGKLAKGAALNGVGDIASKPAKAVASVPAKAVDKLGDGVGGAVSGKLSEKLDEVGGPSGMLKDAAKSVLPFGGGGGSKGGLPGVGKGRRMPVQQSVDIGLPIETVYNQWTQFEEWPTFMHRITRATQEDECTVSFEAKIWTRKREFTAKLETQRPNERIKWSVSEGLSHTGVVTFHELGPNLTRVLVGFDVQPGGLIEKFARGARHIKRASRADLHRFKAFVETQEHETGAWRGRIEEGELVEEHDPSYDEGREYSDGQGGKKDDKDEKQEGKSRGRAQSASRRSTQSNAKRSSSGRRSSGRAQSSASRSRSSSRQSGSGSRSTSRQSGSGSRSSSRKSTSSGSSSSRQSSGRGRANSSSRSGSSRSSSGGGTRTQASSRSNGRG